MSADDFFNCLRTKMEHRFGASVHHPHPGVIGPGLTFHQAMYSMIPTTQSFEHLQIPYDQNAPRILSQTMIQPIEEEATVSVDMEVD